MPKETIALRLRTFISAGVISPFGHRNGVGIEEKEIAPILVERIAPTKDQATRLDAIQENYKRAIKVVNVEMARGRFQ